MQPLLDPSSSCNCSMLPATSNNNNDGNLLINISLAINKQINANLGHKLRLWPETVQRKMQSATATACLPPASCLSSLPQAEVRLQQAACNRPYKCKCSTRRLLALLWGNFSFDSIFIFYYAPAEPEPWSTVSPVSSLSSSCCCSLVHFHFHCCSFAFSLLLLPASLFLIPCCLSCFCDTNFAI